jgi:hypothetical protein
LRGQGLVAIAIWVPFRVQRRPPIGAAATTRGARFGTQRNHPVHQEWCAPASLQLIPASDEHQGDVQKVGTTQGVLRMRRFTGTTRAMTAPRRAVAATSAVVLLALGLSVAPGTAASAAARPTAASTSAPAGPLTARSAHPVGGVTVPTKRVSAVDVLRKTHGRSPLSPSTPVVGVSSSSALAGGGLSFGSVGSAPAAEDLRDDANQSGDTLVPPVGNQGNIGSCLPWTVAHTLMGYYAKKDGGSGAPFSPLYLYMMNTSGAPTSGTNPERVLEFAKTRGVDTQADYFQGYYDYQVKPTLAEQANAANYKVTSWTTLWAGWNAQGSTGVAARRALIENSISTGNPVIVGFNVYSSFDAIRSATLYTTDSGMLRGGHMVTAVAYDAEGVTLRNQWGTWWGDHGDARVSWNWLGTNTFGAYTISGVTTPAADAPVANPKATIFKLSATRGSAEGGTAVDITGTNLTSVTKVNFGTASAAPSAITTVNGVTTLKVTTPAGSIGSQFVTLTNGGGDSAINSGAKFYYTPVPPRVDASPLSVTRAVTEGGTSVTVSGLFLERGSVLLAGRVVPTSRITARSNTAITFTAPPHLAGDVLVSVRNVGGTTPAGTLTYVPGNPPVIQSLSRSSASILWANQLTVTGSALTQVRKAVVAGRSVSFLRVSDTELLLRLPRTSLPVAGDVVLSSQWSTSAASPASAFSWVRPDKPAVTSVTGLAVNTVGTATVTGTGLEAVNRVSLVGPLGRLYSGYGIVLGAGGTSLTFTAPKLPAGAYTLTVTNPAGVSTAVSLTLG